MRIIVPANDTRFTIPVSTDAPTIDFQTDGSGPHVWDWKLQWRHFNRSGQTATADNRWSATSVVKDLGGALIVHVRSGASGQVPKPTPHIKPSPHIGLQLKIIGTNTNASDVDVYLSARPDSAGFGAILAHETKDRHFTGLGEPVVSFDGGYGICQLTSPAPTYEQCWSWKRNIDAGLVLFAAKRRAAITYLSQQGRSYTADQLTRETVSRWNGGAYHTWDGRAWVRNPDIICDSATGNIGWDMANPNNQRQTPDQLHARDAGTYRRGHQGGDDWRYSGVCYADAILGG